MRFFASTGPAPETRFISALEVRGPGGAALAKTGTAGQSLVQTREMLGLLALFKAILMALAGIALGLGATWLALDQSVGLGAVHAGYHPVEKQKGVGSRFEEPTPFASRFASILPSPKRTSLR